MGTLAWSDHDQGSSSGGWLSGPVPVYLCEQMPCQGVQPLVFTRGYAPG